jgi:adenylate cyclase
MSTDYQMALTQKQRELDMLLKLDGVRDTLNEEGDPQAMFDALVTFLRAWFAADGCALILVAETSDDVELFAASGIPEQMAHELCRAAMGLSGIRPLHHPPWKYMLGVQIILGEYPMGGLVLARNTEPFSDDDHNMLTLVESQLDSAVIQARTIWKLSQHNQELQAIYEIDRLRDRAADEIEMMNRFTGVAIQYFQADLCLILLAGAETPQMIIRGIVDKYVLSSGELASIRETAQQITIPQVIPTPEGIQKLVLLAAPLVVAGERLGAVIIGRDQPFSVSDHRLLHAIMSQMDSAVVFARTQAQLAQRKEELEIIYKIDRIRDREKDLDTMLQVVLTELSMAVSSEMGFVNLYHAGRDEELELRAFTADGKQLTSPDYLSVVQRVSRLALQEGRMIFSNTPEGSIRSYVTIPLILNERVIGVFGVVNSKNTQGFSAEDRRMLAAITSQVDTAIFERLEQRRMRAILSRSVDPKVVEHLLERADFHILAGERVLLSVLFADLRGSTEWAERTVPEELVATLNAFLGQMTDVILEFGGTLDKFVGDQVIGLFGTPVHMDDHAYRAVAAAAKMQAVHVQLQTSLRVQGRELPDMGIGISSGEAIAGEVGHRIRSEFTALGRIVNLGSRLCGAAEAKQTLISEATYQMVQHLITAHDLGQQTFKGISQPSHIYELVAVKS